MSNDFRALLCEVKTATACIGAYGAPRITRRGHRLLDDAAIPEEPMQSLRRVSQSAYLEDRKQNPLHPGDPWHEQVAIRQEWLITPPDENLPMDQQNTVWRLLGCDKEMNVMQSVLQPFVEEYAGEEIVPVTHYGPRLYQKGSILLMHLDRYPVYELSVSLVCSGAPWEMYFLDASLAETGVTSETTSNHQHLIYEGCRMLHGRPEPCREDQILAFFHYHRRSSSTGDPTEMSHDFRP